MNSPAQWRPPGAYRFDGPISIIPGRIASIIMVRYGLDKIRSQIRGMDSELDTVLVDLATTAAAWRSTACGTERATTPEPGEQSSQWVNTSTAATLLGITDRAIRKAIDEKRLTAQQVDGRWRITREDVEHYRAARAA